MDEDLKDKPVVMFCTGGIRCEKASRNDGCRIFQCQTVERRYSWLFRRRVAITGMATASSSIDE